MVQPYLKDKMKQIVLTLIHLFIIQIVFCQKLTPGFDSDEYFELLKISSQQGDSIYNPDLPLPEKHSRIYRSPVMGLDNRWELWESEDSVGVISIRGTTTNQLSWVENFFCAMVPATDLGPVPRLQRAGGCLLIAIRQSHKCRAYLKR